ncbi:UNKNOWN [Stylonychia lemnae]|uniref:Cadg multi-domain protein n=1 Tax=Stylonychia lemnae TaxID=5949 RepID=A0A078AJ79_STYLE|nr:UNKNOWN [Stylonychia lemnae]|eukprot:CDW81956.1 UNKNOWN [Stylonychia lemnae]
MLIAPFIYKTTNDQIHIFVLKRSDLTRVTNFYFTFPSTVNLESASAASDSNLNIYLTASYNQIFFAKISSSFTVTEYRMWKQEYTSYYSSVGIVMYLDTPYYAFKGLYASTNKDSFMIFKDSKTYNYVDIPILASSETQFYPTFLTTSISPIITILAGVEIPGILQTSNQAFLTEVGGIKLNTMSFSNLASERQNWGTSPLPNEGVKFPDSTIYEFIRNTGTQTIKFTQPSANCQGKPIKLQVLNPLTDTQIFQQAFVSFDSIDTVFINTNSVVRPLSFSLKVRYADEAYASSGAFFDYPILIRIVAQQNLTIEEHNWKECFQNQFSMSFGSNCGTCYFYSNGFYLNKEDENIILVGQAAPTNAFLINEDNDDGFIARISQTGWVYWLNQVSAQQNVEDAITAVTMSKGFIYCFFHNYGSTEPNRIHAILKITYEEGKIQWTKRIIPSNPIDSKSFIVSYMRYMVTNPYNDSQIMTSLLQQWNAGSMYSGNILLVNDGDDIKSDFSLVIKPLAKLAGSMNSAGYIVFHPDSNLVYLAHAAFTTSATYQDLMVMKLDISSKQILWSNTFNDGRQLPNWDPLQPALAFCNKTQFLYMVTAPYHSHIIKLNKDGQTLKEIYVQITLVNLVNVEIVINENNGNVILVGSSTQYYAYNQFDMDLVPLEYTYRSEPHNGARITRGNVHQKGSDYYLMGINMYSYGTSTPSIEVVFWKHHYDFYKKMYYDCHAFPPYNLYSEQVYPAVNTAIQSLAIIINPNQLQLLDADFIKSQQMQTYGPGLLYPNSDKSAANFYYDIPFQCENTGLSPPSMEALPAFEVNMGELKSFDISALSLKQCQKMKVTYTIYDEARSMTRTTNNNFITINQNSQLVVDARNNPPFPSQRILQIQACIQMFSTKCSWTQATLVIWPSDMIDAPKTEGATECQGLQEFPKILGYPGFYFSLTQADMDKDNGNFVICGRTSIQKYKNIQYPNSADGGLIVFSSIYGQIYWAYNVQKRINTQTNFFSSCVISSDDFIYTIIYRDTTDMNIIKMSYERGKVLYTKMVTGTFDITKILPKLWIDNESKNGYISGYRNDITAYSLYLQKQYYL